MTANVRCAPVLERPIDCFVLQNGTSAFKAGAAVVQNAIAAFKGGRAALQSRPTVLQDGRTAFKGRVADFKGDSAAL